MSQIAATMPEARFRTTKKRVHPVRPNAANHRAHVTSIDSAAPAAAASANETKVPLAQAAVPSIAAPAQKAEKKAAKKERKLADSIVAWWPVGVAIFLTGFVQDWHTMAVQGGIWYERVFFPLALLAGRGDIGLDAQTASSLPHTALMLQLPLEGLWTKLTLDRSGSIKMAVVQLLGLHAVCTLVLWLITFAK